MKWLIDGHNLIGRMPGLRLSDPDDEEKLLAHLRRFRAKTGHDLTVIFDAGPAYQPGSKQKRGGITIQFVSPGQTADQYLIRRLRRVKNPQEVRLVTSDQAIVQIAQHIGVRVTPSQEFAQQLLQSNPATGADEDDIKLTPEEVDEWLNLFNQKKS